MRIVTRRTRDACILLLPATAIFETVRRETDIKYPCANQAISNNILPGAMAGAAEVHRTDGVELGGGENQLLAIDIP